MSSRNCFQSGLSTVFRFKLYICNNLRFELRDHNYSHIREGFISRTLVDRDFDMRINSIHFLISGSALMDVEGMKIPISAGDVFVVGNNVKCSWEYRQDAVEIITKCQNAYIEKYCR